MTSPENIEPIVQDLLTLGIQPGGVLLVHSSLRSLGPVPGGAETVVRGLVAAVGANGTLLMPALSYATVGPSNPIFDVTKTPSCVGALPEYFRTWAGTIRSAHPTHSVSGFGALAVDLLVTHAMDTTPCGRNSPFSKIPKVNGQVLFIGCGLRPNTSMHAIEELVTPPYLYGETIRYKIIQASGHDMVMNVRSHNFKGVAQRYDRLDGVMGGNGLRKGRVLQAECVLLDAAQMWAAALEAYRRDPLYFVEPIP